MTEKQLEESGWRQGSIVRAIDLGALLKRVNIGAEKNLVLLLASQSCDIANSNIESEPIIELSVARRIDTLNGNLTHNKSPRRLHASVTSRADDSITEEHLELKAYEKVSIPKESFVGLIPDQCRALEDRQLKSYVAWLAARYSRPALPTAFNDRIRNADPKDRLRKKVKKGNEQLTGIYVEITPDTEIAADEFYRVNLLGLLPAGYTGDRNKAENVINTYAETLRKAGMDVKSAIRTEDEVTLAVIRRFKRFYYDDLSYKANSPLPPETKTNL